MSVTQEDLELFRTQFINLAEALRKEIHDRFDLIERAQEAIEKQLATITLALGEHGCVLEGLVNIISTDDMSTFKETVKAQKKKMLEVMQQGASAIEGEHSKLATTLESMVDKL